MLKSALVLLVNPLMFFQVCMLTVALNKARYIERNKDAIKRCPFTSLMYFYVIYW